MICYICNKTTTKGLRYLGINFGYCEDHAHDVQVGVVKFILTGKIDKLNETKEQYVLDKKGSASIEFEKQKETLDGIFEEEPHTENDF